MGVLSRAKYLSKLYVFKRRWRKINPHNRTVAQNVFPIEKVVVGRFTYGPLNVLTWGADEEKLVIGDLVSIAPGVKFLLGGNHRTDTISTFPIKVMFSGYPREAVSKGPIVVEDDVWIGMDAIILSGSKIGKGCVIGAGAVVSGEIPPYSIAIGNPCRVIKKRFTSPIISKLIEVDFSSIPIEVFVDHIDVFYEKLDKEVLGKFLSILKYGKPILSDSCEKEGQKDGDE